MVVLDIVSICLIDSPTLLEDLSTPIGRIWDVLLQSTREKEGNLNTSWGRLHQELHTVLLFTMWVDRKCRNDFHHAGQGITAINCFLRHQVKIRFLLPPENAQISPAGELVDSLEQDGLAILIVSLKKNSNAHIQHDIGHVWDKFKISLLESIDQEPLDGDFHTEVIGETMQSVGSPNSAMLFLLPHESQYVQEYAEIKSKSRRLNIDIEMISPLHSKRLNSPQSPHALPIPSQVSQLFSRDARNFARSLPSSHNPVDETRGPILSWRPPNISYEIGTNYRFDGVVVPALSLSFSHPFHPKHATSYFETISFIFKTSSPDLANEHTQAGLLWREYRKQIALRKNCLKISVLTYHAIVLCVDIVIEWDNIEDSKNCHASPEVSSAREALISHLATERQPTPSPGYPFYPDSELKYAEMVDFELSSAASETDRRAFEYYLKYFHSTMDNHTNNISTFDGGKSLPEYPVSVIEKGWIEPPPPTSVITNPSPHDSGDDSSKPPPTTTYRVIYNWTGPAEEAFWTAEFIRIPYTLTGHRAHWIALAVDRVVGKTISLKQETKWDFIEPSSSDEDLGF